MNVDAIEKKSVLSNIFIINLSGSLVEKTDDLNIIYSNYCQILKEKELKDYLTIISEAAEIAIKNKQFYGFNVFIDEFSGFSIDELKMLEVIISQADEINISLTITDENNSKTKLSPFVNVIKTQQSLIDIAKKYKIKIDNIKCEDYQYNANEILHLNKNIFNPINIKYERNNFV